MKNIKPIIYQRENKLKPTMLKSAIIASSLLALSNLQASNVHNWTGFYAGPRIGVVFNDADLHAQHLGFTDLTGQCNTDSNFSSFFPGLQVGYAHQFDSRFVLGIEGDFTINTKKSGTLSCPCFPGSEIVDRFSFRNSHQSALKGRVGYVLNSGNAFLPYIMGGGSFARLGLKYSNEGGDYYSKNTTKSGWLAGAGLAYFFSTNWSISAEYFHSGYDDINLRIPIVYGLQDLKGKARGKLDTNNIAMALNYWL